MALEADLARAADSVGRYLDGLSGSDPDDSTIADELEDLQGSLSRLRRVLDVPANEDDPQFAGWLQGVTEDIRLVNADLLPDGGAGLYALDLAGRIAEKIDARAIQRCAQIRALAHIQDPKTGEQWLSTASEVELEARRATLDRELVARGVSSETVSGLKSCPYGEPPRGSARAS